MAERVVDALEVVDVHEEDGELLVRPRSAFCRVFQAVQKARSVGDLCEGIVGRLVP